MKRLMIFLALALSLAGCIDNSIIRGKLTPEASCDFESYLSRDQVSDKCKYVAVEQHNASHGSDDGSYDLHFVEFDDQGWMHHPGQMKTLFTGLESKSDDPIIAVFVHGWRHNADPCDENVCCFRETLKAISRITGQSKRVVGVYVGWRGLSSAGLPLWTESSFYGRKNAASRVAMGSVRELLIKLRNFHERRNRAHGSARLIVIGHSFGGSIVYSAISDLLLNNVLDFVPGEEETTLVKGFGDLVVLVNPAFESVRYEPLFHASRERQYSAQQKPVLVTVTADNDWATGKVFPVARWINSMIEKYSSSSGGEKGQRDHEYADERKGNVKTVGHVNRYRTHTLDFNKSADGLEPNEEKNAKRTDPMSCVCSQKKNIAKVITPNQEQGVRRRSKTDEDGKTRQFTEGARLTWDAEEGLQLSQKVPFWVVRSEDRKIINGHSDFFTVPFLGMLRELLEDAVSPPAIPRANAAQ
jgi:hypothetical protein